MKKFFFDLFPVILFFAAFKVASGHPQLAADLAGQWPTGEISPQKVPLLLATAIAILATAIQIIWSWYAHRHVNKMLWVNFAIISILGGATLLLNNPVFVKWKPTVLYWVFSLTLLVSALCFRRNLIQMLFAKQIQAPDFIWERLNYAWIVFFTALGFLNLYVAYHFSENAWVDFKLFGITALLLAFMLIQGLFIYKYFVEEDPKN